MNSPPDLATLQHDAETGIAAAQYNLGVWYLTSPAETRDRERARYWFEKSAAQSFVPARSALGYFYLRAPPDQADPGLAADWFETAAADGYAEAQYRLGELYGAGFGRAQDSRRAFDLFELAAEQGHAQAMCQAAYCLDQGLGCKPDHLASTRRFAKAAQAGNPRAQAIIASRYDSGFMLPPDKNSAAIWYARAARAGYRPAQLAIGDAKPDVADREPGEIIPLETGDGPATCSPESLSESPRVFLLKNFMSTYECFLLIENAGPYLQPSMVLQTATGQNVRSDLRRSGTMRYQGPLRDIVVWNIEQRIARYSGLPAANGEALTILHYGAGDEYRPHYDYFDPAHPGSEVALKRGGQRVATFMTYLNDVADGGDTEFIETGLRIPPRQGSGVLFFNLDKSGQPDPLSLHAGTPVKAGVKWVATRWIREREFI